MKNFLSYAIILIELFSFFYLYFRLFFHYFRIWVIFMKNESVRLSSAEVPAHFLRKDKINGRDGSISMHHHNETELLFIREGRFPCTVDGERLVLGRGEMLFINSRVPHSTRPENSKYDMIQINCDSLLFGSSPKAIGALLAHGGKAYHLFTRSEAAEFDFLFEGVFTELSKDRNGKNHFLLGALHMICSRLISRGLIANPDELAESKKLEKLSTALSHISDNYTSQITTPELAAICNLNTAYFCELFKSATGKTPIEFINALRIRRAEELISATDMNMTEIALALGFSSPSYFDRVFRKMNGNSPREFRTLRFDKV